MQSEGEEEEEEQRISWRLGPRESVFHPKVSRTHSVSGDRQSLTLTARRDLSVAVRSSPDGSAGNYEERKPTTANKQIDEDEEDEEEEEEEEAAGVTPDCFCGDSSGCESRANPPPDAVPHDFTGSSRPCPQQKDPLRLSVTEGGGGGLTEADAKSCSPVASESRDELLQCEAIDSFALEDVLRHYWLLSDHDDDAQRMKLRREPIYGDAFDWLSKRSVAAEAPYLIDPKSPEPSAEAQREIASSSSSSSSSSFQYERDEDADSVVTLSTISEEDSEEISSVDASLMTASLFGDTESKFRQSSRQKDAEILKERENFDGKFDGFSTDDLSAVRRNDDEDDGSSSEEENSENPEIRIPDGLDESEEHELSYPSNAFDSLVRTFSRYVSDVYPYSPAFISHPLSSREDEGQRWTTTTEGKGGQNTHIESRTQLEEDDSRGKLQLVLQEKDPSPNTSVAGYDSPDLWYSANGSGNVSTIASPTSWYTISDVFDAHSYDTASENTPEDGSSGGNTAFARCTAFARYDETQGAHPGAPPLPLPHPPGFRSSVTARVTAGDPIVALSKAAARAATLAAAEVVKSCDRCPANIEVALTANCAVTSSQFGDLDDEGVRSISKTDVTFERLESHHASGGAHFINCLSKTEDSASIFSTQRFNSTAKNALSDAATDKAMSDLDRSAEFSCGVAIPRTRNGKIKEELDANSVIDVQDFTVNPDSCELTSVAVLDCAKIKKSRSKKDSADVEVVLNGIKIVTDDSCQTSDVVYSAVANNSAMKTNSADIQTTNSRSNSCTTHGTVKPENSPVNPGQDREKVGTENKKPAPPLFPSELLDGERRMERSRSSDQLTRSLSHLLETDIDTLEHRITDVSRNASASSVPDFKSSANLLPAQQRSEISNEFCLWNSSAPSFNKEALEEMLSDSSPARYLTKKQSDSEPDGRYSSQPNLQPSGVKGYRSSGEGKGEKSYGNVEHSFDGVFLSDGNDRALHKCSLERIKSNISSPQKRDENASTIERYEHSPSLRRRSLSVLSTPSSDRYGVPGTTPPEMQRRLGQGQARTKTPDSRRLSLRPVSSSFENLVDSLLGITAIMSMETAAFHSRPLFASKAAETRRKRGDSSPLSIQRRELSAPSLPRDDEETSEGNQGPSVGLCSDSLQQTTPVHSVQAVRKRVHFRKAKHIFRKCSFCIEGNDRKTGISPTRNRTALVSRKDENGAAKRH